MPNRVIKESACTSETLANISADAERLFWRLVVQVDDYGCYDGRHKIILGKCLTAFLGSITNDQVESWLGEMESVGLIRRYEVDGQPYLQITAHQKHQRSPRAQPKFPLPPPGEPVRRQMTADDSDPMAVDSKCGLVVDVDVSRYTRTKTEAGSSRERAREDTRTVEPPAPESELEAALHEAAPTAELIGNDDVHPFGFYEKLNVATVPSTVAEVIEDYLRQGLKPSAVKWAIREQHLAGGKGALYLRRILQRLLSHGLTTAEQAQEDEQRRRNGRARDDPGPVNMPVGKQPSVADEVPDEPLDLGGD